jgi:hypothetical protein
MNKLGLFYTEPQQAAGARGGTDLAFDAVAVKP